MAVTAQLSPRLFIGGFAWTGYSNQIEYGVDAAVQDVTTWDYVPFSNFVVGLKTLSFNAGQFVDYATSANDEWLRSNIGTQRVVSLAPLGETTTNTAVVARGILGGYRPFNAQVGAVPTSPAQVSGGVVAEGQVTSVSTSAVTATANSTPVNIGAVAAGKSVYAAIHIVSVSGTTPSLTAQIQSSTTSGGAYTNRGSASSAQTAAGDVWLSAAGALTDTWWRIAYTVSGTTPSFSIFASLAIV